MNQPNEGREQLAGERLPGLPSRSAREQYEQLVPLVRRAAIRLARRLPSSVSVSDLATAGLLASREALASVGAEASPEGITDYLWYRIRLAMLDLARRAQEPDRALLSASQRLLQAIRRATCSSGAEPDEDQIAAAMSLSREEYRELLRALASAGRTELDLSLLPLGDPERGALRSGESTASSLAEALAEALAELPAQLQQILALRHQGSSTPGAIGAALDLDEERVLELEVEAIHRLRARMGSRSQR